MSAAAPRRSPYVGLVPYSEEDWEYFFGREAETELIIANLTAARLTLLYGASGVGKSSVLRAGVAHRLRQLAAENRAARGTPEFALVIYNAWRDDPLAGLLRAAREAAGRFTGAAVEPPPPGAALADALRAWSTLAGGELLVILDQFEEYFLYHGAADGPGSFAVEFPRLVNREDLRVNFLVAIREDALARLDRFKGRIPNLFENYLRLQHLGLDAAQDAVRKPVERFNARYPGEAVAIDDALVPEVLAQTRADLMRGGRMAEAPEGAAAARIETPYLQMVMTRLWDEEQAAGSRRLRRETFTDTLGGAERIVRTHLDREMARLAPGEQDLAAQAFRFLVTRSGTKIALSVEDLAGYTELPPPTLAPVLGRLAAGECRILRPVPVPDRAEATRYEIFHDVLGPAIADWRRRHEALKEQEAIRREEEERRRAELQAAEDRREKERSRFLKIGASVLAAGVLALLGALGAAWQQRDDAIKSREEARNAQAQAEEESRKARLALDEAQRAREQEQVARKKAEEESRLAQLAIYDPKLAAQQSEQKAQAAIQARASRETRPGTGAPDRGAELRQVFLAERVQPIEDTAKRLGLLNERIRFRAQRFPLEIYSTEQRPVYQYSLGPVPDSVPGGLQSLAAVTYKMNDPSFKNKLLTGDPGREFRAYYVGWGSMNWVPVLIEYADRNRPPEVAIFAMTENVEDVSRGASR